MEQAPEIVDAFLKQKGRNDRRTTTRTIWSRTMTKSKPKSPFLGRWRIVSMSAWEDEYVDVEVEAFIEFNDKGDGSFQIGYVQGQIDHRTTSRGSEPAVEFSWEGGDGADGTPLTGSGLGRDGDR
jgi:hypothetical protein